MKTSEYGSNVLNDFMMVMNVIRDFSSTASKKQNFFAFAHPMSVQRQSRIWVAFGREPERNRFRKALARAHPLQFGLFALCDHPRIRRTAGKFRWLLFRCSSSNLRVFVRSHYGGQRFANSEGSFRDGAAKITGLSCVGARSRIFWFFIRSFVVNIINQLRCIHEVSANQCAVESFIRT